MKILFISDIHGSANNLSVINNFSFDTLVILGDIYDNFSKDNDKVKNFILNNKDKIICVKGNCDSDYDFVNLNLPVNNDYIKIADDDLHIFCTHGHRYNYHNLSYLGLPSVLIYGHEHIPYIKRFNDMIYICVGSISKPRKGSKASFCIYDNKTFTIYAVDGEIIEKITI